MRRSAFRRAIRRTRPGIEPVSVDLRGARRCGHRKRAPAHGCGLNLRVGRKLLSKCVAQRIAGLRDTVEAPIEEPHLLAVILKRASGRKCPAAGSDRQTWRSLREAVARWRELALISPWLIAT